mgnify:FL=1
MNYLKSLLKRKELPLVVTLRTGIITYIDTKGHVHIVDGTA